MLQLIAGTAESLLVIAIAFGVVYAFVKAALSPIHAKLDRLIALQEQALRAATPDVPAGTGR